MVIRSLLVLTLLGTLALAAPKETLAERESAHYRIITLPTPEGVIFEAGALCFLGLDKLACSTRLGDIWIAEGVLSEPPKPKWTQFAAGLHEVLGLAVRPGEKDGWLYATQRGEITRLRDTNGDGRADDFETFCDGWGINGDYHEYAFGSKFDREGNLWVVLCLTGSFGSDNPYRGWCLRITPEGKVIPTNSGVRSPGGIGMNAAGDVFYTDNQGPWNGACKLQWLKPGAFVGHPGGNKWFDKPETREAIQQAGLKKPADPQDKSRLYPEARRIPELLPPAVYYPYPKMGQSAAGLVCDLTNGKFGPFREQLFVGDQTQSIVMRTSLEMIEGRYQGACYPFKAGFDSGCLGLEFASDGSLFVYGTDRGWGARGGKPFALQRLVFTGNVPFEIHEMKAKADGFELIFTEPVDPASIKPESFTMQTYTYIYQASYGSPEVDQTKPAIKAATVAADGRRVRLVLEALAEGHVHELQAPGVRSAKGEALLHAAAYYTLFQIPKP
jgi:glucose/arabinose dehydrogenase